MACFFSGAQRGGIEAWAKTSCYLMYSDWRVKRDLHTPKRDLRTQKRHVKRDPHTPKRDNLMYSGTEKEREGEREREREIARQREKGGV